MFIGKVVGTVVSTIKDEKGVKLAFQVVQELDEKAQPRDKYVVAADTIGRGRSQLDLLFLVNHAPQAGKLQQNRVDRDFIFCRDFDFGLGKLVVVTPDIEI